MANYVIKCLQNETLGLYLLCYIRVTNSLHMCKSIIEMVKPVQRKNEEECPGMETLEKCEECL